MRKRPMCLVCLIFVLGICLLRWTGVPLWGTPSLSSEQKQLILEEKTVRIRGNVAAYEKKKTQAGYILSSCRIEEKGKEVMFRKLYLIAENPALPIGSEVEAVGTLHEPEAPGNPGQYDARAWYKIHGIPCFCRAEKTKLLDTSKVGWKEAVRKLRETMESKLYQLMPEEEAGVMAAMLLGDRTGLEEKFSSDFQQCGIFHILAISGMHLMILGMSVKRMLMFFRVRRIPACILAGIFMTGYGFLTGFGAATVRAAVMFGLRMGAEAIGRTYDSLSALSFTVLSMVAVQPEYLFYSGFQFSVVAVLGAVWIYPVLSGKMAGKKETQETKRGSEIRKKRSWMRKMAAKLTDAVLLWVSVTLSLLPLLSWYYGELPTLSLLPNLLIGPSLPAVLLPGLAGCAAACFCPVFARAILFVPGVIVEGYHLLSRFLVKIPGSVWICGQPEIVQLVIYGTVLVLCLLIFQKTAKKRILLGMLPMAAAALFYRPVQELSLTVLDVGQGDAIVVQSGSFALMVDGGSTTVSSVGKYRILPFLKQQGIGRLQGIVVTHPDEDHINGILELLAMMAAHETALRVERLFLPVWMKGTEKETLLVRAAQNAEVMVQYLEKGDRIRNRSLCIDVLHPESEKQNEAGKCRYLEETNAGSIVLQLQCGTFSALLTGDLEGDGEEEIENLVQPVDFLKVAHHGSRNSTGIRFLQKIQPVISVFSAAYPSRYGHPHRELLERLKKAGSHIYGTPSSGAVTIQKKKDKILVRGYRSSGEFVYQ